MTSKNNGPSTEIVTEREGSHSNDHTRSESEDSSESPEGIVPQDYDNSDAGVNRDAFSPTLTEEEEDEAGQTFPGDMDIVDIEVTNTETETTVNLIHLLGRRNGGTTSPTSWDKMESIEESESEDCESEEEVIMVVHNFTGLIPALLIYNENNCLIETIHRGRGPLNMDETSATLHKVVCPE